MKQTQASARSQVLYRARANLDDLYGLHGLEAEPLQARIQYLLENDRFTCHETKYETATMRFTNSAIANLIHLHFCKTSRSKAYNNPDLILKNISGNFVCFISSALFWALYTKIETTETGKIPKFTRKCIMPHMHRFCATYSGLQQWYKDKIIENLRAHLTTMLEPKTKVLKAAGSDAYKATPEDMNFAPSIHLSSDIPAPTSTPGDAAPTPAPTPQAVAVPVPPQFPTLAQQIMAPHDAESEESESEEPENTVSVRGSMAITINDENPDPSRDQTESDEDHYDRMDKRRTTSQSLQSPLPIDIGSSPAPAPSISLEVPRSPPRKSRSSRRTDRRSLSPPVPVLRKRSSESELELDNGRLISKKHRVVGNLSKDAEQVWPLARDCFRLRILTQAVPGPPRKACMAVMT
ncbi:hypothetical protein EDC01DRAFT_241975 [Geopyxis carbonaria]|nr:hypothetical protein EDC01DRAFT_241975 [Geopyxis carbonaria]